MVELLVIACLVSDPTTCQTHDLGAFDGSLNACVMGAIPRVAQWSGDHPKWSTVRIMCVEPKGRQT